MSTSSSATLQSSSTRSSSIGSSSIYSTSIGTSSTSYSRRSSKPTAPQAGSFSLYRFFFPALPETSREVRAMLLVLLAISAAVSASLAPFTPNPWVLFVPQFVLVAGALLALLLGPGPHLKTTAAMRSSLRLSEVKQTIPGALVLLCLGLRYLVLPLYAAVLCATMLWYPKLLPALLIIPATSFSCLRFLRR